jgi:hypothetical protein
MWGPQLKCGALRVGVSALLASWGRFALGRTGLGTAAIGPRRARLRAPSARPSGSPRCRWHRVPLYRDSPSLAPCFLGGNTYCVSFEGLATGTIFPGRIWVLPGSREARTREAHARALGRREARAVSCGAGPESAGRGRVGGASPSPRPTAQPWAVADPLATRSAGRPNRSSNMRT